MPQQVRPKLILYIIMAMSFLGGYIYYSQGTADELVVPPLLEEKDDLGKLKDLNINFTILENPKLKALRTYGEYPVSAGTVGNKKPLIPVP